MSRLEDDIRDPSGSPPPPPLKCKQLHLRQLLHFRRFYLTNWLNAEEVGAVRHPSTAERERNILKDLLAATLSQTELTFVLCLKCWPLSGNGVSLLLSENISPVNGNKDELLLCRGRR